MIQDESLDDVVRERGGDAQDEALQVEAGEGEGAEEEGAVAAALDHQAPQRVPDCIRCPLARRILLVDEAVPKGCN